MQRVISETTYSRHVFEYKDDTFIEVDNFIQKTKIENEKEDNSVFKCIIGWFEITFTNFCC